eukprot:1009998-Rhodomonas_salina.5
MATYRGLATWLGEQLDGPLTPHVGSSRACTPHALAQSRTALGSMRDLSADHHTHGAHKQSNTHAPCTFNTRC